MHSPAENQSQQQMQQRNQQETRQEVQQRHREIVQNQILKPSRDWKPGQALPSRYYGQGNGGGRYQP